jgi:hypothetical protein
VRRKLSGSEWTWFLEEESEPRKKRIFLAGENPRAWISLPDWPNITGLEALPIESHLPFII